MNVHKHTCLKSYLCPYGWGVMIIYSFFHFYQGRLCGPVLDCDPHQITALDRAVGDLAVPKALSAQQRFWPDSVICWFRV